MTRIQVIDTEIAPKGKCYFICLEYDEADFEATLSATCDLAVRRGARELYLTFRDTSADLKKDIWHGNAPGQSEVEDCWAAGAMGRGQNDALCFCGYMFYYDSDFYILQKQLEPLQDNAWRPMRIKPLRADTAELFCALYNEAFFAVPNATTMTPQELDEGLCNLSHEAGYFMLGGMPAGIFILRKIEGGRAWEIVAICIRPDLQGQGHGRHALETLEAHLLQKGARTVQLVSADANTRAHRMYLRNGYRISQHMGKWYRATSQHKML